MNPRARRAVVALERALGRLTDLLFTQSREDVTDSILADAVIGAAWPLFWAFAALILTIGWIVDVLKRQER